jgi:predicted enzyme related to lactoylglutathione lyase
MAKIGLVLDCADPEALGSFWAAALGYDNVGRFGTYVVLLPPEPGPPKLLLQAVPEEKAGKNRMHLDLDAADIEVEAQRLETLGARRQDGEVRSEFGTTWIQMADPEGNEFCVCDHGAGA